MRPIGEPNSLHAAALLLVAGGSLLVLEELQVVRVLAHRKSKYRVYVRQMGVN